MPAATAVSADGRNGSLDLMCDATSEHVRSTASSTTDVGHMVYGVETVDIDENLLIFTRSPQAICSRRLCNPGTQWHVLSAGIAKGPSASDVCAQQNDPLSCA